MRRRLREPTALEKTFMVRHIWECQDVRKLEKDPLKEERKWLAERFGCSEDSAQAICAHARIRFDAAVPGELSVSNAEFARRWVALASNAEERAQYQREIAEQLKIDLGSIQEITDGVRVETEELIVATEEKTSSPRAGILSSAEAQFVFSFIKLARTDEDRAKAKRDLAKHLGVDQSVILETLGETQPNAPQPTRRRVAVPMFDHAVELQKGGEHVDYDTENKESWRQTWKRFVDENTNPRDRKWMRILCLPAKQCLEIPLYIDLGFRAENIVAVEGGDRIARAQFELAMKDPTNLAKWGGQPDYRLARLEDIIRDETKPFDIVSLDFLGQMCSRNLRIASSVPIGDQTLFLMTTWTRRWGEKEQQERDVLLRSAAEANAEETDLLHAFKARHADKEIALSVALSGESDAAMGLLNLGIDRNDRWLFQKRLQNLPLLPEARELQTTHMQESIEYNLSIALEPLLETLAIALIDARCVRKDSFDDLQCLANAGTMANHVIFQKPVTHALERWQYQSTVSSAMHEFHTDMGVVRKPVEMYEQCKPTADFLLRCAETAIKRMHEREAMARPDILQEFSFDVAITGRREIKRGAPPDGDIICRMGNKTIAKISIAEFIAVLRLFGSHVKKNPLHHLPTQCSVPRQTIS